MDTKQYLIKVSEDRSEVWLYRGYIYVRQPFGGPMTLIRAATPDEIRSSH